MEKESKISVLGATGLVGGAILRNLIDKGYKDIIATYNKTTPPQLKGVKFVQVNLTRQNDTEEFFNAFKPEYVFLAAARVGGILANNTYKAQFIYENMAIALNVIDAAFRYRAKKLLNLGSSCIYPKFAPQPMKEEHLLTGLLEPTNEPYAIAKISAIKLCRYYNEQYGTNFISTMPTNLYGPGDNFNLETSHVLPALIRKFHLARLLELKDMEGIKKDLQIYPIGYGLDNKIDFNKPDTVLEALSTVGITINDNVKSRTPNLEHRTSNVELKIWGTGEVFREFLYVDDLAQACIYLMENVDAWDLSPYHPHNLEHGTKNREQLNLPDYFVNIGTGEDIKIKELATLIKGIVGFQGNVLYDTSKPDGTPKKLLDVSKIKKLGWQPKIALKEGIKKVYKSYVRGSMFQA
ncbi:MAG TPA: GDP-L-fucose synthase [Syntrophorhabdaceae bacterium]|nr:GDP-L-fucose synthase [Syntrophorhabdaceae bacterium]